MHIRVIVIYIFKNIRNRSVEHSNSRNCHIWTNVTIITNIANVPEFFTISKSINEYHKRTNIIDKVKLFDVNDSPCNELTQMLLKCNNSDYTWYCVVTCKNRKLKNISTNNIRTFSKNMQRNWNVSMICWWLTKWLTQFICNFVSFPMTKIYKYQLYKLNSKWFSGQYILFSFVAKIEPSIYAQ